MAVDSSVTVLVVATVALLLQNSLWNMLACYIVPTVVMLSLRRRETNRYHALRRTRVMQKSWAQFAAKSTFNVQSILPIIMRQYQRHHWAGSIQE